MFKYVNLNPRQRKVDDCTVRAIALATNRSWDETFKELCAFAQAQAIMPNDVIYINEYLERNFKTVCGCKNKIEITVGEFIEENPYGTYLITMNGHITCCIDGCIYDTFDPSKRLVWGAYKVE